VQGGSDIADGSAGEYENPLFLHDLWFTLNGLKDDFLPLLLNLKDSARIQTHIVSHMLRDNNPSESIQRCFHISPPTWQFAYQMAIVYGESQINLTTVFHALRVQGYRGSRKARKEKLKAETEQTESQLKNP
jgi:hypothetical protein